ncbi:hypothetical protein KAR91_46385 [Candidatus Pacearchaeota archaeon]|nr:hypothetical protein [Candidatus Pacearchaeota archaeon]
MKKIINSDRTLLEAQGELAREYEKYKFISVKTDCQKRSIISNALQFHWYKELETQGDMTANEYRRYCKYHFGLALRAAKDDFFAKWMKDTLKRYIHEERLAMMDYVDVTSTFDRPTMSIYLNEIKIHFQTFVLTNSEDL